MKKFFALTKRNVKEILRDPLALIFCIGFPVVMLVLLQTLFANLPVTPPNFQIENYSVGICIFGYTFAMLFCAMLVAGDKNTEFVNRLNMAPVSQIAYLFSYPLAVLPVVLAQTVLFFAIALLFKLPLSVGILVAIIYLLPSAIFYLAFGLLLGTVCKNEKQVGPVSSVFISATGMLGGVFMPIDGLGTFSDIVNLLPFGHTVKIASGALSGDFACIFPHLFWVVGYTALMLVLTLCLFKRKK